MVRDAKTMNTENKVNNAQTNSLKALLFRVLLRRQFTPRAGRSCDFFHLSLPALNVELENGKKERKKNLTGP